MIPNHGAARSLVRAPGLPAAQTRHGCRALILRRYLRFFMCAVGKLCYNHSVFINL